MQPFEAYAGQELGSLRLEATAVHLWSVELSASPAELERCKLLLPGYELDRAARFLLAEHRRRYVVSHAALRIVLAAYCGLAPARIRFREGAHGKPELCGDEVEPRAHFNLAHSGELAVIAVAPAMPLGVDVELLRHVEEAEQLGAQHFTRAECGKIAAFPAHARAAAFLSYWTGKEAYLKALGHGLQEPLDRFEIEPLPGIRTPIHEWRDGNRIPTGWFLQPFAPRPGYIGAVAMHGEHWVLQCRSTDIGTILPSPREHG